MRAPEAGAGPQRGRLNAQELVKRESVGRNFLVVTIILTTFFFYKIKFSGRNLNLVMIENFVCHLDIKRTMKNGK